MKESKITALYERLSVDDGYTDNTESNSIQNQKLQLEEYARANGFTNITYYTDDGESGRFFDRENYVRMMNDIENGKVGVCIVKDVSRIGRDYIRVGLCMETMRINGVRLINAATGDMDAWKKHSRLSLGGTNHTPLDFFLNQHKTVKELVFCLDNDSAGRTAAVSLARKYADKGYYTRLELPTGKDHNEDLQALKRTKTHNIRKENYI